MPVLLVHCLRLQSRSSSSASSISQDPKGKSSISATASGMFFLEGKAISSKGATEY